MNPALAQACGGLRQIDLKDVKEADAVVTGKVIEHRVEHGLDVLTVDVGTGLWGTTYIKEPLLTSGDKVDIIQGYAREVPEGETVGMDERVISGETQIFVLKKTLPGPPIDMGYSSVNIHYSDNVEFFIFKTSCAPLFDFPFSLKRQIEIQEILDDKAAKSAQLDIKRFTLVALIALSTLLALALTSVLHSNRRLQKAINHPKSQARN